MAHFAQLDDNNVVTQVIVISNDDMLVDGVPSEAQGIAFCNALIPGKWVQTSYNTIAGVHVNGGTPLRKNFAAIGDIYNEELDAFVKPNPNGSYQLNEETGLWDKLTPQVGGN
jgi:hypothetical protein